MKFNIVWMLALVLSVSTFFVLSEPRENDLCSVSAAIESAVADPTKEYQISVGKNASGIRAMSTAEEDPIYTANYSSSDLTIQGGTDIKFDTTGNQLAIKLHDTSDQLIDTITFSAKPGYRLNTIRFGSTSRYVEATYNYSSEYDEDASSISFTHNIGYNAPVTFPESITPEQLDPTYTGKISITFGTPVLVTYKTDMYDKTFIGESGEIAGYNLEKSVDYKIDKFYPLPNLDNYVSDNGNQIRFSSWLLMADSTGKKVDSYSIEPTEVENIKYIELKDIDGRWVKFKYTETSTDAGNNIYYEIYAVSGCANFVHSIAPVLENDPDIVYVEDENMPDIIALWSYEYNTTINANSDNPTWKNDEGYFMSGVYSHGEENGGARSTTFKTYNRPEEWLGFQRSTSGSTQSVFNLYEDVESNKGSISALGSYVSDNEWYYVYNYGYEISSWVMGFYYKMPLYDREGNHVVDSETGNLSYNTYAKYFNYDSGLWSASDDVDYISIGELDGELADLTICAEQADASVFVNGYNGEAVEIFIYPVWTPATFNVITDDGKNQEVTYSSKYGELSTAGEEGKSCAYLTTNSGAYVALKGEWYYRNITDFVCEDGAISLSLEPHYAANIYRANLSNIDGKTTNYITGDSERYNDDYLTYAKFLTIESYSDTTYRNDVDKSGIEDYVAKFISNLTNGYLTLIKYGYYDIEIKINNVDINPLNKVYNDGVHSYVYLVYGHNMFGVADKTVLPIYTGDGYILDAWINTGNYDYYYSEKLDTDAQRSIDIKLGDSSCVYSDEFTCSGADNYEPVELYAHYAQQYYYLNVDTIVGNSESFHGYAVITKTDKDNQKSYYLAISDEVGTTSLYTIDSSLIADWTLPVDYKTNSKFKKIDDNLMVIVSDEIYIQVYDQGKDRAAANNFDAMIGYRFDRIDNNDLSSGIVTDEYHQSIDMETLHADDTDDLTLGGTIEVDIYFTPIEYTITFSIDDGIAGKPMTAVGAGEFGDDTEYTTNVTETKQYKLRYFANVGYEFKNSAFSIIADTGSNSDVSLNDSIRENQQYAFNFNVGWLKSYFYKDSDFNVSYNEVEIRINTQAFDFEYLIELNTPSIIEVKPSVDGESDYKFRLNNGTYTLASLNSFSIMNTNGDGRQDLIQEYSKKSDYVILKYNGKEYAVLKSYLEYVGEDSNPTMANYAFPLLDSEEFDRNTIITLNSEMLASLIDMNYLSNGNIVSSADRNITMVLDVREMKDIKVQINIETPAATYDSDNTERSVLVNVPNNNGGFTEYALAVTSICRGNDVNNVIIYTYDDNVNTISVEYNSLYYTDKQYKKNETAITLTDGVVNGTKLFTDNDIGDGNALNVVFIPTNTIRMNVVYKMYDKNGGPVNSFNLSEYMSWDVLPNTSTSYYLYNYLAEPYTNVSFEYGNKQPSYYNIYVYHDDVQISDVNNFCVVEPTSADYSDGVIDIEVRIEEIPTSSVSVSYALIDPTEARTGDDFGTIDVYVDGDKVDNGRVPLGSSLAFDIDGMGTGYEYVSLARNNSPYTNVSINDKKLTICDSYNVDDHAGTYVVYIRKIKYNIELDTSDATIKEAYSITDGEHTSGSELTNVYIGKVITATAVEQDTEVINGKFYYEYGPAGNKTRVDLDTTQAGGVYRAEFTFDKTLINRLNGEKLIVKFNTIAKYKLDIAYELGDGVTSVNYNTVMTYNDDGVNTYKSGAYVKSGTLVNVKVTPEYIGKFDIMTSGCVVNTTALDELNEDIVMIEDKVLTIKIDRREFNINSSDDVVISLDGQITTDTTVEGVRYDTVHTIEITTDDAEKILKILEINGNDSKSIKIDFEEEKYYYSDDGGVNWIESNLDYIRRVIGYNITIDDAFNKVTLVYTVKNEIDINARYNDYKDITQTPDQ